MAMYQWIEGSAGVYMRLLARVPIKLCYIIVSSRVHLIEIIENCEFIKCQRQQNDKKLSLRKISAHTHWNAIVLYFAVCVCVCVSSWFYYIGEKCAFIIVWWAIMLFIRSRLVGLLHKSWSEKQRGGALSHSPPYTSKHRNWHTYIHYMSISCPILILCTIRFH